MRVGTCTSIGGVPVSFLKPYLRVFRVHLQDPCAGVSRVLAMSAELAAIEYVRAPEMIVQAVRDSSVARRV
jgi:hypothetical protein